MGEFGADCNCGTPGGVLKNRDLSRKRRIRKSIQFFNLIGLSTYEPTEELNRKSQKGNREDAVPEPAKRAS